MSEFRLKRNRDPLAKTKTEMLYEPESQGKKYYLEGGQSSKVRTPSQVHRAVERALNQHPLGSYKILKAGNLP